MAKIVKQRKKTRDPIHKNRIKVLEKKIKKMEIIFCQKQDQNLEKILDQKLEKLEKSVDQKQDHKLDLKLDNFISRFHVRGENVNFQAYDNGDPHILDTSKV